MTFIRKTIVAIAIFLGLSGTVPLPAIVPTAGAQTITIPDQLRGTWVHNDKDNKQNTLTIKSDGITWVRTDSRNKGRRTIAMNKIKLESDGISVSFPSTNACFGPAFTEDGEQLPVTVSLKPSKGGILLRVSTAKKREGGVILTCSRKDESYTKSKQP